MGCLKGIGVLPNVLTYYVESNLQRTLIGPCTVRVWDNFDAATEYEYRVTQTLTGATSKSLRY